MKISLNRKISELNDEVHNGDLSLSDYRDQRRKELDALNSHPEPAIKKTARHSKIPVQRVIVGTSCAIVLLFITVMVAKLFL
jgi:hypothetical protein